MRIISGQFKGKKIFQPRDESTRPLKDLVKESIFNIIQHSKKIKIEIENSKILDLFSGVGSFGIEALSRGAQYVMFVENYNKVVPVLKKNIEEMNLNKKCEIVERDIFNELNFQKIDLKLDIIFLDPPYKEKNVSILIERILKSKILKKNGIMILHRNSKEKEIFIPEFRVIEEKKYGISKIIFANFST